MSARKDGCFGSMMQTARVASPRMIRQKAMIFSVREKASSGAVRREPRFISEREREAARMGVDRAAGPPRNEQPMCHCALYFRPAGVADARGGFSQRRTKRRSVQACRPGGAYPPERVDFAGGRPY